MESSSSVQDSANNSTSPCYLKKTLWFKKYMCLNLKKRTPSYLTRPRLEYQYFRQILWIFVESSPAKLFMFWTIYWTQGPGTQPHSINFTIWIQLDLGHRLLVIAVTTTNLESWPCFPDIWLCTNMGFHDMDPKYLTKPVGLQSRCRAKIILLFKDCHIVIYQFV